VRFIYILHKGVKWPMMVIVFSCHIVKVYPSASEECVYCLHLQDDSLIQADAEVTVWKECVCCMGRLWLFRAMEWGGGIGLVVSQWELVGNCKNYKNRNVCCCCCCCHHCHHHSLNHTSQHLSDGQPSPIPDCQWD